MDKFRRRDMNRSLETLLDMDKSIQMSKNVVRQPTMKLKPPGQGLEFNNLSYSVKKKQKKDGAWITKEAYLLNDISGQAIRGEILAIMGPSGAGKSTFLDALAGRIARGSLEGSVRLHGKPVSLQSSLFLVCMIHYLMKILDYNSSCTQVLGSSYASFAGDD